jgi:hypothetical protein
MGKILKDLKESTKKQHEITKARHALSVKTPADASAEFKERHEQAVKAPIEKQKEDLKRLQAGKTANQK